MEKKLYIFRHGQTDANKNDIWQGCLYDLELNSTGQLQAAQLAQKLKDIPLDVIYSSPLTRAKQTAQYVSQVNISSPQIKIIADLREGNFGEAEGMKKSDLNHRFSEMVNKFLSPTYQTWDLAFPGDNSESKHQIFDRTINVLKTLVRSPENNIGIATHGGVLSALSCGLDFPKDIPFGNCTVWQINYDTDTGQFSYIA